MESPAQTQAAVLSRAAGPVTITVKKPSIGALSLGLIPFAAMCFSVSLWDRIDPMLFGLPFNLFWLITWVALTTVCMSIAYRVEAAHNNEHHRIQ
jgi:hypothetical protein